MDAEAVCRRDAGALLSTVLQGVDAEESDAGYVLSSVNKTPTTPQASRAVSASETDGSVGRLCSRECGNLRLSGLMGLHSLDPLP